MVFIVYVSWWDELWTLCSSLNYVFVIYELFRCMLTLKTCILNPWTYLCNVMCPVGWMIVYGLQHLNLCIKLAGSGPVWLEYVTYNATITALNLISHQQNMLHMHNASHLQLLYNIFKTFHIIRYYFHHLNMSYKNVDQSSYGSIHTCFFKKNYHYMKNDLQGHSVFLGIPKDNLLVQMEQG